MFSGWTKLEWRLQVEEAWKHWSVNLFEFRGEKQLGPDLKKKNSVGVSKLNKNIIQNVKHYLFQVQNKEFISKNHGESLLGCPV